MSKYNNRKIFFYSDIDIKKIFDKLIDNGCKVLMECSCKISKNNFSPNRRILGISEPDNNKIFYYLKTYEYSFDIH